MRGSETALQAKSSVGIAAAEMPLDVVSERDCHLIWTTASRTNASSIPYSASASRPLRRACMAISIERKVAQCLKSFTRVGSSPTTGRFSAARGR